MLKTLFHPSTHLLAQTRFGASQLLTRALMT